MVMSLRSKWAAGWGSVGGSAYWRIGVWGKEFDGRPTLPLLKKLLIDTSVASEFDRSS